MAKMIVELEWNDELGDDWMDLQILEHLLYGQAWTKREYLSATDLTDKETCGTKIEYSIGKPEDNPCGEITI